MYKIGTKNHMWKGDKVGYDALHDWLNRWYGKADKCENLNCLYLSKSFYWAKLKNKGYERKRENFWMLCAKCHSKYDWLPTWKPLTAFKKGHIPANKGIKKPMPNCLNCGITLKTRRAKKCKRCAKLKVS